MNTKIKIKTVDSIKDFPYVVSVIVDVLVDAVPLPGCSRRFLNFLNNDSITLKLETNYVTGHFLFNYNKYATCDIKG